MCSSSLCQGDMTCSFVKRIEIEFRKVFSPLQAIMQMSFHCSFFLFSLTFNFLLVCNFCIYFWPAHFSVSSHFVFFLARTFHCFAPFCSQNWNVPSCLCKYSTVFRENFLFPLRRFALNGNSKTWIEFVKCGLLHNLIDYFMIHNHTVP